ncbi:MAG: tRNA pseudouridine(38-40) synthase TruA [Bacilli bacterium]|nr:tRNA pseudouridine(38-40) synthase TruA [Bacilli bacterium]
MKYLISISYDGSNFYGFERLKNDRSVQGEIEKVLTKINKEPVEIRGAGRTDRYVHAYDQKAHFELKQNVPITRLKKAINSRLPSDIRINDIKIVDDDFHARFDCVKKVYKYYINTGKYDIMKNNYLYNYNRPLNIKQMKKATKYLLGAHSYKAFCSGERASYDSIIDRITIKKNKDVLEFTFIGKSFYRYMVRNMMGAILMAGEGKIDPIKIKEALDTETNTIDYATLPACGLYLMKVEYNK